MTTLQIYFTISAAVAIAIVLTYLFGLTVGHRECADTVNQMGKRLRNLKADREQLTAALQRSNVEVMRERDQVQTLAERLSEARKEVARWAKSAHIVTNDDRAHLMTIIAKLQLARDTWAGLRSNEHAQSAGNLAAWVSELLARTAGPAATHPDTALIEWLDANATYWGDAETGELRFNVSSPEKGFDHIREVLELAIQQQADHDLEELAVGQGFGVLGDVA